MLLAIMLDKFMFIININNGLAKVWSVLLILGCSIGQIYGTQFKSRPAANNLDIRLIVVMKPLDIAASCILA